MWLVTPALDYKNAASKLFAFSVMGEYLPEEGIEAALEVYYIQPGATPQFQNLTSSFSIPQTSDEELTWVTFHLDLAPYAATMADVFYMAFRYVGPNGADGAVTYYIDNVSWGRSDLQGIDDVQSNDVQCTKVLRDGTIYILRGEKIYTTTGQVVR